jgi:hypothetical protein
MKNRKREIRTSGSVRDEDGQHPHLLGHRRQFLQNSLNGAGPQCIALGFNECAFSVVNGNTLTLTLTHPLDAGPQLRDPYHPQGEVLAIPATLSTTATQVKAGQTITASGSPISRGGVLSQQSAAAPDRRAGPVTHLIFTRCRSETQV